MDFVLKVFSRGVKPEETIDITSQEGLLEYWVMKYVCQTNF